MSFSQAYLDEYTGYRAHDCAVAFIVILTIFVALRFFGRWVSKIPLSWDDWLMIPALLSCVGVCAITIVMVQKCGIGHHIEVITPEQSVLFEKLEVVTIVLYSFAITFPKLAIVLLFLRIFIRKLHRNTCYILMIVLVSNLISLLLVTLFECVPLKKLWVPDTPGHCVDIPAWWKWSSCEKAQYFVYLLVTYFAVANIITDVIMLVLPISIIQQLQVSTKTKIGLLATLCTGGVGLITSLLRFVIFFQNTSGPAGGDLSWEAVQLHIYSIAEPSVYTIAACLPVYRSLYLALPHWSTFKTKAKFSFSSSKSEEEGIQLTNRPIPYKDQYANLEDSASKKPSVNISSGKTLSALE